VFWHSMCSSGVQENFAKLLLTALAALLFCLLHSAVSFFLGGGGVVFSCKDRDLKHCLET
jgi:hypothetical protein